MSDLTKTLVVADNGRAAFVDMLRTDRSDYYATVEAAFLKAAKCRKDYVKWITLYADQKAYDIPYTSALAGPDGMVFSLIVFPTTTGPQLQAARDKLRREQDVVSIHNVFIEEIIPFQMPARPCYKLQIRGHHGWGDLKTSIDDGPYELELFPNWEEAERERKQFPNPSEYRVVTDDVPSDHDFY